MLYYIVSSKYIDVGILKIFLVYFKTSKSVSIGVF